MKTLLINSPFRVKISKDSRWPEFTKSGTLYYPFWLSYATAVLMEKSNHQPLLIDAVATEMDFTAALKKIENFKPELVVVETSTPTIHSDVEFVNKVKEISDAKIAVAGKHVSAMPIESMKMSNNIDFILRGEYDYTVKDIADALENNGTHADVFKKIPGITFREDKKFINTPPRPLIQDLDATPFVSIAYKKFLNPYWYRYALAQYPMLQTWTSRGCPARCVYCDYPQVFTLHTFRMRSPENVVDEIEFINKKLPQVREIFFEDDTFTINRERVLKICEEIKERDLDVIWSCNARAQLDYELMKTMKDAGARILIVGYESGNQQVLNNIRKGVVLTQAERFTRDAKKVGLRIFGCFMIGLPGDTKESIEDTFQFAKRMNPDMVFFQQAVPFPGTEFYAWAKHNGYLVTENFNEWLDENGQLKCLVSYPNLSSNDINEIRDKLMVKFYTNPKHVWQTVMKNLNPVEGVRVVNYALKYLAYLSKRMTKARKDLGIASNGHMTNGIENKELYLH